MAASPTGRTPRSRPASIERVVGQQAVLGRDVQLVAELPEVGDAQGQRRGEADVDRARGEVGEGVVGQVGRGEAAEQLARPRALDREQRRPRRHVGDRHVLARQRGPADHRLHPPLHDVGRHHEEALLGQAGHGQVGGDAALRREPLRVDDPAHLAVDVVGRQSGQDGRGVGALHHELGHQGHVHDAHAVAHRPVLGGHLRRTPAPGRTPRPGAGGSRRPRTTRRTPSPPTS